MPSPWTALLALSALCVGSGRVAAQRADKPTAEVLFQNGVALMEAGEYGKACPLLEQSEAVDHGIGTMLYLAECYERSGRNASAWAEFRRAASLASAAGQLERARAASERAASLEPLLSSLTITVDGPAPGLIVERDGAVLPPSAWDLPVPVDPGEHTVAARADGHVPWSEHVYVGASGVSVTHHVPPLALLAQAEPAPLSAPRPRARLRPQAAPARVSPAQRHVRCGAIPGSGPRSPSRRRASR